MLKNEKSELIERLHLVSTELEQTKRMLENETCKADEFQSLSSQYQRDAQVLVIQNVF